MAVEVISRAWNDWGTQRETRRSGSDKGGKGMEDHPTVWTKKKEAVVGVKRYAGVLFRRGEGG